MYTREGDMVTQNIKIQICLISYIAYLISWLVQSNMHSDKYSPETITLYFGLVFDNGEIGNFETETLVLR